MRTCAALLLLAALTGCVSAPTIEREGYRITSEGLAGTHGGKPWWFSYWR